MVIETKKAKERRYQQMMYDKWIAKQLFCYKDKIKDNENKLFVEKRRRW